MLPPANLGELRNLSCTPLFSKVLESFVLTKLKEEIKLSSRQYGGIKASSTDHFLLETWDRITNALNEPNSAANLISIDFQKAFNRMDHTKCLESLANLNANDESIDLVAAFLYNRTMSVKIGSSFSSPWPVPGGSPQGSILGNFLFCASTNKFAELELGPEMNDDSSTMSYDDDKGAAPIMANGPVNKQDFICSTPTSRG